MQILRQTEFFAIPLVIGILGVLFILFAAFDAGLWAWLLVGAVGVVVWAVLGLSYATRHRHPVAWDAPHSPGPAGDASVHRVLVIADDACTPDGLRAALGRHANSHAVEAFVVAPALGSRLGFWTGDQGDYDEATAHLDATLRALEEIGVEAHGRIGAKDPIQAADDGLREFPADEIVLAVHPADERRWLEHDAVDAARERYDVPVTPIVVHGHERRNGRRFPDRRSPTSEHMRDGEPGG